MNSDHLKKLKKSNRNFMNDVQKYIRDIIKEERIKAKVELLEQITDEYDIDYQELYDSYVKPVEKVVVEEGEESSDSEGEDGDHTLYEKVKLDGEECYLDKDNNRIYDKELNVVGEIKSKKKSP